MLTSALIYLCAAVISVPVAKRLGLGSVLGYLIAGVLIGPYLLNLIDDQSDVMHFAEFGVVMMLFLIGLELRPSRLWELRKPILGLGGMQVTLTALIITLILVAISDNHWKTGLAIGLTIALSSTAIVIQSLSERGQLKSEAGNNAFSVLLFQDIAVIPIVALFPLLAISPDLAAEVDHKSLVSSFPVWAQIGITLLTISAIIFGGKYLSAPVFRYIAETHLREIFTAFALLLVVAIALLMQAIGLSPALGTFLAGVVLADSEFRHEMEIDIEPFKGLLLGLFFITVGASIDFNLLFENPLTIALSVFSLVVLKIAILGFLAHLFRFNRAQGTLFAFALAQGGEFAFVLVSLGNQTGVYTFDLGNTINLVVALSMLISPLLLIIHEWFFSQSDRPTAKDYSQEIEPTRSVIIAGYGRFGQIIGRLLSAQGYNLTILDHSPSQIDLLRRFGNEVFYGDASRKDLLKAAGADEAQLLVIAVDEPDKTLDIIKVAKTNFPQMKIIARAIDRRHAYELLRLEIDGFVRETFDSALNLGIDALKLLGHDEEVAKRAGELFAQHDDETLNMLSSLWGDDKSYGVAVRQRIEDLKQVLQSDLKGQESLNTCHAELEGKNKEDVKQV
ncbi:monovalent cation:proton antiporter-2 (CPA2) family protein [Aliikangiella coralliicola]|uniref:Potassium transporter n=1 Tax=Aliikangiella coralliicola TaxID=2592383 RepID=A0A545UCL0_9GAMM|nr:monovalent cation:proton antiporter-2 (CPA2) family protein [Aliikangiella coralliicola]TQV87198.1 potassium transporter [Aliikangiella coralliicola]